MVTKYCQYVSIAFIWCSLNTCQGAKAALQALGSSIPKPEFIDLLAGFEHFTKTGTALPEETVEALQKDCDCAMFGAVR